MQQVAVGWSSKDFLTKFPLLQAAMPWTRRAPARRALRRRRPRPLVGRWQSLHALVSAAHLLTYPGCAALAGWDGYLAGLQKVYTDTVTEKERLEAELCSSCSRASMFEQEVGTCRGVVQQLQQENARLSADMEVVTATNKRLASQMEGHQQQLQQEIQTTKRYKLNARDAMFENDEIKKQLVARGLRAVLVEMGLADDE